MVKENKKKSEIPLQVAGQVFENKFGLLQYIKDMMSKYEPQLRDDGSMAAIDAKDQSFLKELFQYHPKAASKL